MDSAGDVQGESVVGSYPKAGRFVLIGGRPAQIVKGFRTSMKALLLDSKEITRFFIPRKNIIYTTREDLHPPTVDLPEPKYRLWAELPTFGLIYRYDFFDAEDALRFAGMLLKKGMVIREIEGPEVDLDRTTWIKGDDSQ